jgi:hypothetical protein
MVKVWTGADFNGWFIDCFHRSELQLAEGSAS